MWPKKPARATLWIYWQEETNLDFHTYVAPRSLTWMQPNLLQRCLPGRQVYKPNLMQIALAVFMIRVPNVSFKFLRFSPYSSSFCTLRKITIKCKRMQGSSWNLVHQMGALKWFYVPIVVQIRYRFPELWLIVRVKQNRLVVMPTG